MLSLDGVVVFTGVGVALQPSGDVTGPAGVSPIVSEAVVLAGKENSA